MWDQSLETAKEYGGEFEIANRFRLGVGYATLPAIKVCDTPEKVNAWDERVRRPATLDREKLTPRSSAAAMRPLPARHDMPRPRMIGAAVRHAHAHDMHHASFNYPGYSTSYSAIHIQLFTIHYSCNVRL